MSDFVITFTHPWLLLLLIPAIGLTLFSYFTLSKRYRKNRNRITSVVLHSIVMTLAVFIISGMAFSYTVSNDQNEIVLLVDVSRSEDDSEQKRDDFIKNVLYGAMGEGYRVGLVTFGFDQEYAVPFTTDLDAVYEGYENADRPDYSATDIASALTYASEIINYPQSSKIVLVTDGKQTDNNALSVIRSVSSKGIKVDVANISSAYEGEEAQVIGIQMPDYHLVIDEECSIGVTVQSNREVAATVNLYDNGNLSGSYNQIIPEGIAQLAVPHTFATNGIHEIYFTMEVEGDLLNENNCYYSYAYLEVFNKVLIIERKEGESEFLKSLLTEKDAYKVEVKNINSPDDVIPTTVDEMRKYDQIILNNIANAEMPANFGDNLYSYVFDYGGGVFTVGGDDEEGNANAYSNSSDKTIYGSLYQQMLPVQLIKYTPPVGVMVLVDRSTSMAWYYEGIEKMEWAKQGTASCLNALTERDYIGIITFSWSIEVVLEPTPRTQEAKILAAIDSLEWWVDGTSYPDAIVRAGQILRSMNQVAKKHIILVSDGQVPDGEVETYEKLIKELYDTAGITFSVVGLGMEEQYVPKMERAAELGHGRSHNVTNLNRLVIEMREDLNAPEIKDLVEEPFSPIVNDPTSPLVRDLERDPDSTNRNQLAVQLDGFYGVKVKSAADLVLVGDYEVPIYAQWKFGKGMVGSFMCDLNGVRSSQFITDESGRKFVLNVVENLMPVENIQPYDIDVTIKGENYVNQMSVLTDLKEGEYIDAHLEEVNETGESVSSVSLNSVSEENADDNENLFVTQALGVENNYTRANFVIKEGGAYKITVNKCAADGSVLSSRSIYKVFSYSKEYSVFDGISDADASEVLQSLASRGNGAVIEDNDSPMEVYDGFLTRIPKQFDPRYLFAIIAITLFLTDIAVRKFKFKWIHEIIRDRKAKKNKSR